MKWVDRLLALAIAVALVMFIAVVALWFYLVYLALFG